MPAVEVADHVPVPFITIVAVPVIIDEVPKCVMLPETLMLNAPLIVVVRVDATALKFKFPVMFIFDNRVIVAVP